MGSFLKGLLGGFSGKVGNLVGSSWKSIDYMRSLPRKSSKGATLKQLAQQQKFALAVDFVKPIKGLVNMGFARQSSGKMTGFNVALRHVLKEAISGEYPNFAIDYSKVRVSDGVLPRVTDLKIKSDGPNMIDISWNDNSDSETEANGDDKLMLLVFNPEQDRYLFHDSVASRSEGRITRTLPLNFGGNVVHVWAAFVDRDTEEVSRSEYATTSVM